MLNNWSTESIAFRINLRYLTLYFQGEEQINEV